MVSSTFLVEDFQRLRGREAGFLVRDLMGGVGDGDSKQTAGGDGRNGNGNGRNGGAVDQGVLIKPKQQGSAPTRLDAQGMQWQQKQFKVTCPDCHGQLRFSEGCVTCDACGFSKC